MTKIPPKPLSEYPWYIRLLFRSQKKKYGQVLEPTLLWGRTPLAFIGFLLMQKGFNRKKSPIHPILRALLTVKVSQINECSFCVDMNSYLVLNRGGSEEKLHALKSYATSPLFTEKEKAALEYAESMTRGGAHLPDALFDALKSHFTSDGIVELTALIGMQNLSSKFNHALDASPFGFCSHAK